MNDVTLYFFTTSTKREYTLLRLPLKHSMFLFLQKLKILSSSGFKEVATTIFFICFDLIVLSITHCNKVFFK